jgi:hypothetical protein
MAQSGLLQFFLYIHPMTPAQALALINAPTLRLPQPTRRADLGCGSVYQKISGSMDILQR